MPEVTTMAEMLDCLVNYFSADTNAETLEVKETLLSIGEYLVEKELSKLVETFINYLNRRVR
jgi:hypothetical protein